MMTRFLSYIFILVSLLYPLTTSAVMTSTSYTIYADSIDIGGGGITTSTSYAIEETVGETGVGITTSTTYAVRGGYQFMDRNDLSVTISDTSLSLGTLETNRINSASVDVTVTSYAQTGYTLSMASVSGSMPAAVADGNVTTGVEEYGVSGSGIDNALSGDVAVASGLTLASSNVPVYVRPLTLTLKASRSLSSTPGTYSQTITFRVSANF